MGNLCECRRQEHKCIFYPHFEVVEMVVRMNFKIVVDQLEMIGLVLYLGLQIKSLCMNKVFDEPAFL